VIGRFALCAVAALLAGCATQASTFLDRNAPHLTQVSKHLLGNVHSEVLGIHYYRTFAWFKGDGGPAHGPVREIHHVDRDGWSLDFDVAEDFAPVARAWFLEHGKEVDSDFARMLAFLREAYPGGGTRKFRVRVIPDGEPFDEMWSHWAIRDRDVVLTYAFPLSDAEGKDASPFGVFETLAHEFAHSYFWFHSDRVPNMFSNEIVAYTTQQCIAHELFGQEYGWIEPDYVEFAKSVSLLDPVRLYARFHGEYPDTYLAQFAAVNELSRVRASAGPDPEGALARYCRAMPLAGTDFTATSERRPAGR
jgi:hypothetical protein